MFNFNYFNDQYMNNGMNFKSNTDLVCPTLGFNRGNMFANLYEPYKNYNDFELNACNEKDALYLELSRVAFAAHEINLYLDLHPDDVGMVALYKDYSNKENELKNEYEAKYGPLVVCDSKDEIPFDWTSNVWPWEDRYNV